MTVTVRGSVKQTMARIYSVLGRISVATAMRAAERIAPTLTTMAKASFDASETPYGTPWAPGADGQRVTMRRSGALAKGLTFAAVGARVRAVLGVPYAKYQIGRRRILPAGGATVPQSWHDAMAKHAHDVLEELSSSAGATKGGA